MQIIVLLPSPWQYLYNFTPEFIVSKREMSSAITIILASNPWVGTGYITVV